MYLRSYFEHLQAFESEFSEFMKAVEGDVQRQQLLALPERIVGESFELIV